MTNARYFDGKSIRPHDVSVERRGDALAFAVAGTDKTWPVAKIDAVAEQTEVRLSWRGDRDARLVMATRTWRDLAGSLHQASAQRRRRGEYWIAGSLFGFAAATLLFVFVGVPALSGPLAQRTPPSLEARLGDNLERQMAGFMPRCAGAEGQAVLASLGDRIAAGADAPFDIRVQAVQAPMLNAMALPGGRVWVTDDLIREAKSPDELAAVVAHEVAHIEKRHVMQAVLRSLGIGMVLDAVVGGGSGAGQQAVILAGNATELSYGRRDETEADARGQALLHTQGLSSLGMASFFERLDDTTGRADTDAAVEFTSSHPNTQRRVAAARAAERPGAPALTEGEWQAVRTACDQVDYEELEDIRERIERAAPTPQR